MRELQPVIESEAVDTHWQPHSIDASRPPESIAASRSLAVNRVFQGGASILGAAGLAVAYGALSLPLLPVAVASLLLTGGGLLQIGRAAKHLRRFGSKASTIGLSAAGGLGVSLTLQNVLSVLTYYGAPIVTSIPGWVLTGLYGTTMGLAAIVSLVVLRAIALWAIGSAAEDPVLTATE